MEKTSFLLLLSLSCGVVLGNVWTTDCSNLATQRLDPIVFPGYSPAGHVHTIVGGSRFNKDSSYEDLQFSQCTSCDLTRDKSNYWVPQMYIHKQSDGKFHHVENYFAVYYKLLNGRGQTSLHNNNYEPGYFHSFPPGFRMLAGSIFNTEPLHYVNHKCLGHPNPAEENSPGFPARPELCSGGIRSEVTFPSCWDGRLTSEDMASNPHVVHPVNGWEASECPDSHPLRFPTLFFEAIFHVQGLFEAGDSLVYSFNDYQGYGYHGDFFNGWEDGLIDQFLEHCRTQEDGWDTQCGARAEKHPGPCSWELGAEYDEQEFTGAQDTLPPWDGPWVKAM